jgi:hypothetical protein
MVAFVDAHRAEYGVEPICAGKGVPVARRTVERLVGRMGLHGVVRGRRCPFRRSTSTRFGDCAVVLSGNPPFSRLWASASLRESA